MGPPPDTILPGMGAQVKPLIRRSPRCPGGLFEHGTEPLIGDGVDDKMNPVGRPAIVNAVGIRQPQALLP